MMTFTNEQKELLLNLFHLYAPSNKEEPVLNFIKSVLDEAKINYKQDNNGNIYCLNYKNEPLLSAHTDCVGTEEAGYYVNLINLYPYGDDEILKGIGNIGGDDKCGVFLILLYLLSGKPINAVFSICEEIGGAKGISTLLPEIREDPIFQSIPYCIVLDRKNPGDIICNRNGYGSKKFEEALENIGKKYGYSAVLGGSSDMNKIKDYMNGCNLSVGYHNPHSNTEFVSMNDLYNAWNYLNDLIKNMPRDIPLEKVETTTTTNTWNGYQDSMKWRDEFWENYQKKHKDYDKDKYFV